MSFKRYLRENIRVKPFQETLKQSMCAPATLKMLLTYYNHPDGKKKDTELARMFDHSVEQGVSNEDFVSVLPKFGLKAIVRQPGSFADIEAFLDKKVPVVVDWFSSGRNDKTHAEMAAGHYSIVTKLDKDTITLQDPELGTFRRIPRQEFYNVWFDFRTTRVEPKSLLPRWMAGIVKS